jgi:hypothetical protein
MGEIELQLRPDWKKKKEKTMMMELNSQRQPHPRMKGTPGYIEEKEEAGAEAEEEEEAEEKEVGQKQSQRQGLRAENCIRSGETKNLNVVRPRNMKLVSPAGKKKTVSTEIISSAGGASSRSSMHHASISASTTSRSGKKGKQSQSRIRTARKSAARSSAQSNRYTSTPSSWFKQQTLASTSKSPSFQNGVEFLSSTARAIATAFDDASSAAPKSSRLFSATRKRLYSKGNIPRTVTSSRSVGKSSVSSYFQSETARPETIIPESYDGIVFFGDFNYRIDLPRASILRVHTRLLRKYKSGGASYTGGTDTAAAAAAAATTTTAVSSVGTGAAAFALPVAPVPLQVPVPGPGPVPGPVPGSLRPRERSYFRDVPPLQVPLVRTDLRRSLLHYDQLTRQKKKGRVFLGFAEGELTFPPTFKYEKGSDSFDNGKKKRSPAWTDRILYASSSSGSDSGGTGRNTAASIGRDQGQGLKSDWKTRVDSDTVDEQNGNFTLPLLQQTAYYSIDARTSDHRPVCADFILNL